MHNMESWASGPRAASSSGLGFGCFLVLAVVQAHVEDGYESDEHGKQSGWRADGRRQETAGDDRDVHDDNAPIRTAHQLVGLGGGIFAIEQIIPNERDTVTCEQRQYGYSDLRRYDRIHVPDDVEEHLNKNVTTRPIRPAHRRALTLVRKSQYKKAVNRCEPAVVNHEEWDKKQLAQVAGRVRHGRERNLQNVVEYEMNEKFHKNLCVLAMKGHLLGLDSGKINMCGDIVVT